MASSSSSSPSSSSSDFIRQMQNIDANSFASSTERRRAVQEAQALISRLEDPFDTAFRFGWQDPTKMACLGTAHRLELFEKWHAAGAGPKTGKELAGMVACDSVLFMRILRHLAACHIVDFDGVGKYSLTAFSAALHDPETSMGIGMYFDFNMPSCLRLPDYLEQRGFKNPSDATDSPFEFALGKPVWDYMRSNPKLGTTLAMAMKASTERRGLLSSVYPTDELIKQAEPGKFVLVDCGGSTGHDIEAFRQRHRQLNGRLVLQDLPKVIENGPVLDAAIEKMEHDFFKPQPVKEATAYYFHSILHDWPDSDSKKILETLKPAMKPGYSRLLLHEIVMSAQASLSKTASDITMMAMTSAMERTEETWRELIGSAGYKILKIWNDQDSPHSVIEAIVE